MGAIRNVPWVTLYGNYFEIEQMAYEEMSLQDFFLF